MKHKIITKITTEGTEIKVLRTELRALSNECSVPSTRYSSLVTRCSVLSKRYSLLVTILSLLFVIPFSAFAASNIDTNLKYAWGENVGWLNLNPTSGYGVNVGASALTGYMWGENVGWISLSCDNDNSCGANSYGVDNSSGTLTGYAWGENVGWIKFNPTGGGVKINACGEFSGYAWGENVGWINFSGVKTSWVSPIDNVKPVTTTSVPIAYWNTGNVSITLSATDCGHGVGQIHYAVDSGNEVIISAATADISVTTEGCHTLTYYAVDADGNIESTHTENFCIDGTPPEITITTPANNGSYNVNSTVLADYSVTDSVSGIDSQTATVSNGDPISTTTAGTHTFTVSATDNAGNSRTVTVSYTVAYPGNIDPGNNGKQYAWGENVGWINLKPSWGPGVSVTNTAVTGMAWGENIGWINFNPTSGGVVNDGNGNLSGYAWGENVGWINFKPQGSSGVKIDSTGRFSGFAWGENIGWINFSGVRTSWTTPPVDSDNDGYLSNVDCNDGNPDIHPGATEICNGEDDDCDDQTDEGFAVTPSTCGVGECASTGTLSCVNGQMTDSCTQGAPTAETCDGKDNDCDGQTDEGFDNDSDGTADCYDTDDDNDGVLDTSDNCPNVNNPTQADTDSIPSGDFISYWKFEEGTGTTAGDSSGSNTGAIMNGAAWTTSGRSGKALDFDGVDDYVNLGTSAALAPSTFSVDFWMYAHTAPAVFSYPVARWGHSTTQPNSWLFEYTPSQTMNFVVYTSAGQVVSISIPSISLNQWHHVAGTYDGSSLKLYLDGQLASQTSFSGTIQNNASTTSVGCKFADGTCYFPFDGLVDEVAIYGSALTGTEIQKHYQNGLAGANYLPDGIGDACDNCTTVSNADQADDDRDDIGNVCDPDFLRVTKDGSGAGTVTSYPAGINCGATCSATFNSGATVTLSSSPAAGSAFTGWSGGGCSGTGQCVITMNAAKTVTASFISFNQGLVAYYPFTGNANDASGNNNNGIVYGASLTADRFGTTNSAYSFDGTDDYIRVPRTSSLDLTGPLTMTAWINPGNVSGLTSIVAKEGSAAGYNMHISGGKLHVRVDGNYVENGTINTGNTYFVAGVYDGTKITAYVNGTKIGEVNESLPTGVRPDDLYIGAFEPGRNFNGVIDELRIYNHALSVAELQAMYSQTNNPVSPSSHNYGVVKVGNNSNMTFTVTNTGTANLGIGTITITGTDASQFIKQNDNCSNQTLIPSADCTVDVVFTPLSTGPKSASISVPAGTSVSVPLSGAGDNDTDSDGMPDTADNCPDISNPNQSDADSIPSSGFVNYWKFDDGSGTNASDSVGSKTGTISGATWTSSGRAGKALSFDGNDYVTIGNLGSFPEKGTISFWMNPSEVANWRGPLTTKYNGYNAGIRFEENAAGYFGVITGNDGGTYSGGIYLSSGLQANTWYYIVYVWDRTTNTHTGYLNGSQAFTAPNTYWPTTIPDFRVGTNFNTDPERQWKGLIDEVAVYTRVLSSSEIQLQYNNGLKSLGYLSDGIGDVCDNCQAVYNPDQANADNDAFGDACDMCTDKDADGYGRAGLTISGCAGSTTVPDINDDDSVIYPNAPELCDTKDNDGNSGTADGSGMNWYGTLCDGPDSDQCLEGTYQCVSGSQSCSDTTGNSVETCDGTDNDCDAYIDEGFTDTDSDGVKDCVDSDDDNDGVTDGSDNCPLAKPAKTGVVYYNSLQAAYDAAADGATIQSQYVTYSGNLTLNLSKTVTIEGGYNCGYSSVTGLTIVNGNMTIGCPTGCAGRVTIKDLKVQ